MKTYRSEVDGLRAIAVLGVMLFHAGIPGFTGGFTGVDVFFVISGYLITGKLVAEVRAGEFTFAGFYLGRARRLFPALFVTLALTFVVAALLFATDHMEKLAQSTVFAVLSISNFYFWFEAGYWDLENNLKPLLHTWSLSVEEQFYFVWPALVVGLMGAFRGRWLLPAVLVAGGTASLYLAERWIQGDPTGAFYLAPFRVCEFAVGALILWVERWKPSSALALEPVALLGIALIAYPVVAYSEETPFPGVNAMLPCLGAALLIYAGNAPTLSLLWNNRLAVATGRISYSLYLVHWPAIVFYQYWRFQPTTIHERWALVAVSFLLAIPLFRFVEERYRRAPRENTPKKNAAFVRASVASVIGLVVLAGSAWAMHGWPWRLNQSFDPAVRAKMGSPCVGGAGLCAPPSPDVVLIGDSHAEHYAAPVARSLMEAGLSGTLYDSAPSCALLMGAYSAFRGETGNPCPGMQQRWLSQIEKDDPRTVILASFWVAGIADGFSGRLQTEGVVKTPTKAESRELFQRKIHEAVSRLTAEGRNVVLMSSGPVMERPPSVCYERPRLLGRVDCDAFSSISDPDAHDFSRRVLREVAAAYPNVFFFDAFPHLCDGSKCRLGEGTVSFYRDRSHFTPYGAMRLQHHAFSGLTEFLRQSSKHEPGDADRPRQSADGDAPSTPLR